MVTSTHNTWALRLGTLVLWAATAASVGYWGLRWLAPTANNAPTVAVAHTMLPDSTAIGRLLGGVNSAAAPAIPNSSSPTAASTRLTLLGVLARQESGAGAALIAVEKQPAKPFRVGTQVTEQLVLQSLAPRQAYLGHTVDGPSTLTLELPQRR